MAAAVCQSEHWWGAGSGTPGLRTAPSPSALRNLWGPHFHVKDSAAGPGVKGACRTEAPTERPARPPDGVRRSSRLLCMGFFPLQRKEQKYWTFPGAPAFKAAGCTSPFLCKSWKQQVLNAWLSGLSATVSLSFCLETFSLTCLLLHLLKAPASCSLCPLSPERLGEVGGQSEA